MDSPSPHLQGDYFLFLPLKGGQGSGPRILSMELGCPQGRLSEEARALDGTERLKGPM